MIIAARSITVAEVSKIRERGILKFTVTDHTVPTVNQHSGSTVVRDTIPTVDLENTVV